MFFKLGKDGDADDREIWIKEVSMGDIQAILEILLIHIIVTLNAGGII